MPDAESQLKRDEALEPEVVGVVRFELSGLALGPDYPATAISAEIGALPSLLLASNGAGPRRVPPRQPSPPLGSRAGDQGATGSR